MAGTVITEPQALQVPCLPAFASGTLYCFPQTQANSMAILVPRHCFGWGMLAVRFMIYQQYELLLILDVVIC
jgi:hypothetical protein